MRILLVFVLLIMLGLQGCGSDKESKNSSDSEGVKEDAKEEHQIQRDGTEEIVEETFSDVHEEPKDPATRKREKDARRQQRKQDLIRELGRVSPDHQAAGAKIFDDHLGKLAREQLEEDPTPSEDVVDIPALEDDVAANVDQDGGEVDRIAKARLGKTDEDAEDNRLIFRLRRRWTEMLKEKHLWSIIAIIVLTIVPLSFASLMELFQSSNGLSEFIRSLFQGFFGLVGNVLHSFNVATLTDFPLFDTSISRQYIHLKNGGDEDEWFQKAKAIQKDDASTSRHESKTAFELVREKLGPSQSNSGQCETMLRMDIVDIKSFDKTKCAPGERHPFAFIVQSYIMDPIQRLLSTWSRDLHQGLLYFLDLKLSLLIQNRVSNLNFVRKLFTLLEEHTPAMIVDPIMNLLTSLFSFVLQGLVVDLCMSIISVVSAVASASRETNIWNLIVQKGSAFLKWFDVRDVVGKWLAGGRAATGISHGQKLSNLQISIETDNIHDMHRSWSVLEGVAKGVIYSAWRTKFGDISQQQEFIETDSTLMQLLFGLATLSSSLANFKSWFLLVFLAMAGFIYVWLNSLVISIGAIITLGNIIHLVVSSYLGAFWTLFLIDEPYKLN